MSRVLALLGALGALLLPSSVLAAAMCTGAGTGVTIGATYQGRVKTVAGLCLCNGTAVVDGGPGADCDVNTA